MMNPATFESLKGYIYLSLSAFFFSIMSLAAKVLVSFKVPVFQIIFFRSLIQLLGSFCGVTIQHMRSNQWKFLPDGGRATSSVSTLWDFYVNLYMGPPAIRFKCSLRGLSGFGALGLFYYSMEYLSLADASTLLFTAPIWTAMMAKFFLKESFGKTHMFSAVVTILGAVCISRPSFIFGDSKISGPNHFLGSFLALGGSLFTATSYTLIRSLGKSANPFVLSGYFGAICSSLSFPILFGSRTFDASRDFHVWLYMVVAGLAALIGQTLLNMGLSREKAGAAAMLRNLDVVFAFIFEILLLGEEPRPLSLFGAFLVCGAVIAVGLIKAVKKPEAHPVEFKEPADVHSTIETGPMTEHTKTVGSRRRVSLTLTSSPSEGAHGTEFDLITSAEILSAQEQDTKKPKKALD
jgi:drug/metabolite transporter (DMT)-like permease